MNIAEKLVEEFERVICVREHLRHQWRNHPVPVDSPMSKARIESLAQINEVVIQCREALGMDDAIKTMLALEQAKRIP